MICWTAAFQASLMHSLYNQTSLLQTYFMESSLGKFSFTALCWRVGCRWSIYPPWNQYHCWFSISAVMTWNFETTLKKWLYPAQKKMNSWMTTELTKRKNPHEHDHYQQEIQNQARTCYVGQCINEVFVNEDIRGKSYLTFVVIYMPLNFWNQDGNLTAVLHLSASSMQRGSFFRTPNCRSLLGHCCSTIPASSDLAGWQEKVSLGHGECNYIGLPLDICTLQSWSHYSWSHYLLSLSYTVIWITILQQIRQNILVPKHANRFSRLQKHKS